MSFGTRKPMTPKLIDALWDFLRAEAPKDVKRTGKRLEREWKKPQRKRKAKR